MPRRPRPISNGMKKELYIVATPIGNLEDITFRAIRILKEADIVLAEDTRVTSKLFSRYDIHTKLFRYDAHSTEKTLNSIIKIFEEGKKVALVTDAGTPTISDPGSKLVNDLREYFKDEITIIPIPGASALTAALSASGIISSEFHFCGFSPHKKGRKTFFENIAKMTVPVVFYESPHRLMKALQSLGDTLSTERKVIVCRELTKIHEEIIAGGVKEVLEHFTNHPDHVKGECVIIVDKG